jgi:L-iditol 2-dehydrogenase
MDNRFVAPYLSSMRAAVLYGKEDVRIEDVPRPPLKPGELRVRILAALTCGTDLKVYKRGYHAKMIVPPAVFGHELAGVVEEVHPDTAGWKAGERVVAANSAPCGACFFCQHDQENLCDDLLFLNGAYAESIVIPARIVEKNLLRIGGKTRFADAALTEPFACVVQGVNDLALRGGERVLVIGSGPIGLMFAALLQHAGSKVAVAGRGEERLALATRLGADGIEVRPEDDLVAKVKETGRGFDAVVEAVGRAEAWEAAVQLVRKGGSVNFFGGCPASAIMRLDTGLMHYSSLRLCASFHHTPRSIRRALAWIEQGVISADGFVTRSCDLPELPAVFQEMTRGNRAVKTLVRTGQGEPGIEHALAEATDRSLGN